MRWRADLIHTLLLRCLDSGIRGLTSPIINAKPGYQTSIGYFMVPLRVTVYGSVYAISTDINLGCFMNGGHVIQRNGWGDAQIDDHFLLVCTLRLDARYKKKMLTCSLAAFSANNSFCNLSDFSSAMSACSCRNLIFRLTASSDVAPAIVEIKLFFNSKIG